LLSVVSASQLAQARDRDRQEEIARVAAQKSIAKSLVSLIAPPDLYTPGINELGILTIQGNELPAPPPPVNSPQGNGGDNPMNLSQALVQKYQRTIDGNRQASYGLQDR
jgi:hypothetical protein